ncbi:hypothetical protein MSPP1_003431 [Malassezia sp. CBS 17886]|nr:hypothetical protein MSPP1_003431 [Malassezia sp. CBS 17886]
MFWRFGVSSASTLTTLLERDNVSPEQVLDEPDLLQECKSNTQQLVTYLQQPAVLQRLLDYVIGSAELFDVPESGAEENAAFKYPYLASEVLSSEIPEVMQALIDHADELLVPFWISFLAIPADASQQPVPLHAHPLTSATYGARSEEEETGGERRGDDAADKSTASGDAVGVADRAAAGAGASAQKKTYSARRQGPGFSVLAGYWTKVNLVLLERHPQEMLALVKRMPNAVEGLVSHFETPAIVDLLFRLIQSEDSVPDAGIIEWLAQNDLMQRVVGLLSPYESSEHHKAASEFLKAVIALSAPTPSSLNQISMQDTFGGPGEMLLGAGGVNNLLVRELAGDENVNRMVGFMLDDKADEGSYSARDEGTRHSDAELRRGSVARTAGRDTLRTLREVPSPDDTAVEEDEDEEDSWALHLDIKKRAASVARRMSTATAHRDSTATLRPSDFRRASVLGQPASCVDTSSSFIHCVGVFIELIRKNNSDYFEQHLFHTLRNYLLLRRQEVSGQRRHERLMERHSEDTQEKPNLSLDDLQFEDDDDPDGMEEAMAEVAEKMGIVHLGPLLRALSDRVPDLQGLMRHPKLDKPLVNTSVGQVEPLTQTRYCIAELYAELLHCSNMVLLNRRPHVGPQYSAAGTLLGGIDGLQLLARTLQGDDAGGPVDGGEPAREPSEYADVPSEAGASGTVGEAGGAGGDAPDRAGSDGDAAPGFLSPAPKDASGAGASPEDKEDASSIASALSNLSLADLVSQFSSRPPSEPDTEIELVSGSYLKKQFLDYEVLPTLLELFLNHPWNNFLHNVIYDILQQLFNGDMDDRINRGLVVSAFKRAGLVSTILEGSRMNQESSAQPRRIRLGYMGHLNLIAEEVIKLVERYPALVGDEIQAAFPSTEWEAYVNDELRVSRSKEAAPLAGGRPSQQATAAQTWSNLESEDWYAEGDSGSTYTRYLSSQMHDATGDDEDDAENNALAHVDGADDLGQAMHRGFLMSTGQSIPDDEEWGPYSTGTQSAFEFTSTARASEAAEAAQENLTPADWAAEFRRSGMSAIPSSSVVDNDSDSDDPSALPQGSTSSTDSDENCADDSPFVDLHQPASLRQRAGAGDAHLAPAREPESLDDAKAKSDHWPKAGAAQHFRRNSFGGTDRAAELAVNQLPDDVQQTRDGLLCRTLPDGSTATAPLDDAELVGSAPADG